MSVIIRLQNLPWNASALDIRRFFHGLSIPDGGVHIIGGDKGDTFIAFSTDEDARQGMMLTGECLNEVPVRLFLSSKTEMQNVIASARTGPVNIVKPKDESFDRLPSQVGVERKDDFRGSGYPDGRGAGFSDMAGSRNPGSLVPAPQLTIFGGNASVNREADFSQSGNFNDQRFSNQGFNQVSQNQIGSSRPALNSMGPLDQSGLNKPLGSDLFESNLRGEGNQLGFNRSGGRLAEEVKPMPPGRMQGPHGPTNQVRSFFDIPHLDAGSRNGNIRSMDKRMGEMPNKRASQLGGSRELGQFSSDQPNSGLWDQSHDKRDIGRMAGGFGDKNVMFNMERKLDQDFNRPDGRDRDVPRNFDRFSHGDKNFGINEQFNNSMDTDIDHPRFKNSNDFGQPNDADFNRPINQNFSGVGEKHKLMGPNGGNFGRGDERDLNKGRRDSFKEREPFGFGRDQLGMSDQNEFGQNEGVRRVESTMMGQRRDTGITTDLGQMEGFGDDLGSNGPGQFRNGRPLKRQESGKPFGGQENGRPFDERNQGREFDTHEQGRPFGVQAPVRSLMGQDPENALWSSEPMDDFIGGRSGRLERGKIPNLMSPRDHMNLSAFGIEGNHRDSHIDWCLHVFNLPLSFSYRQVRRSFSGCDIPNSGLKLVNDNFGERTGEAFIKFDDEKNFSSALALNNQIVDGNQIRVQSCTLQSYNDAVDSYHPPQGGPAKSNSRRSRSPLNRKTMDLCILIKKMPLKTTVAEIIKFLGNSLQIASAGGPFLELHENQPTGNAVVQFVRERDFRDALLLNRRTLGGSMVSILDIPKSLFNEKSLAARRVAETKSTNTGKESVSEKDRKDSVAKTADAKAKDSGVKPSHGSQSEETCVQLAGLPWKTTNENIFEFFKGMKIIKDGIYIVRARDGKPSGAGYVKFASAADTKRALSKNKQYMGKRFIDVTPISSKQMVEKLKVAKDRRGREGGAAEEVIVLSEDESNGKFKVKVEYTVRMQNLHSDSQLEDIMDFFRGMHPIVDSVKLQYKDGKPTGDGLVSFKSSREAENAIRDFNRRSMLGRAVTLSVWPTK